MAPQCPCPDYEMCLTAQSQLQEEVHPEKGEDRVHQDEKNASVAIHQVTEAWAGSPSRSCVLRLPQTPGLCYYLKAGTNPCGFWEVGME